MDGGIGPHCPGVRRQRSVLALIAKDVGGESFTKEFGVPREVRLHGLIVTWYGTYLLGETVNLAARCRHQFTKVAVFRRLLYRQSVLTQSGR